MVVGFLHVQRDEMSEMNKAKKIEKQQKKIKELKKEVKGLREELWEALGSLMEIDEILHPTEPLDEDCVLNTREMS